MALLKLAMPVTLVFFGILWIGGVFSSAVWGEAPESAAWTAPAFLYVAALLTLWRVGWWQRLLLLSIGMYGFVIEVIGESTGFPFGDYHYTDTLGPALFDVPLALFSAWIVVTAFVFGLLVRAGVKRRWWVLSGPALMVLTDLILEPVATGPMDAWVWDDSGSYYGVPAINFVGWFLVSLPIFLLLTLLARANSRGFAVPASVIVFFIALAAVNLVWGPLLIAGGAALIATSRKSFRRQFAGQRMQLRREPKRN